MEKGKKSCKHIFHYPLLPIFCQLWINLGCQTVKISICWNHFSFFISGARCFEGISCLPSSRAFSSLFIMIIAYNILEPGTG